MRAYREEFKPFNPLHLIIETEEEADYLWCLLCSSPARPFNEQYSFNRELGNEMWSVFNEVYLPDNDLVERSEIEAD